MFRDLASDVGLLALPIAALLLFLAVFVAIFFRVTRRSAASFREMAALPLGKDREGDEA